MVLLCLNIPQTRFNFLESSSLRFRCFLDSNPILIQVTSLHGFVIYGLPLLALSLLSSLSGF